MKDILVSARSSRVEADAHVKHRQLFCHKLFLRHKRSSGISSILADAEVLVIVETFVLTPWYLPIVIIKNDGRSEEWQRRRGAFETLWSQSMKGCELLAWTLQSEKLTCIWQPWGSSRDCSFWEGWPSVNLGLWKVSLLGGTMTNVMSQNRWLGYVEWQITGGRCFAQTMVSEVAPDRWSGNVLRLPNTV